ncbi:MAG: hypothetical protein M9896_17715 [Candidatus Promineofilum sp.]|uniref:InlB B-repeat-containing protein n=1 Tax=Promineifilum sp. TaxID=2664178 RepID=UPI002411DB52|nr:hypothetical protein [Promineifilum sp.]
MRNDMRRFILILVLPVVVIALSNAALSVAQSTGPSVVESPDAVTMVYWTEVKNGTIRRGNADGSGTAQTCVTNQKDPRGLVIASSIGKMYWLEREVGRLRRANLDCPASGIETIGPALTSPDRIALDLAGGKIYWTENGTANRIRRANLDGSDPETVLSALDSPVGIAVDHANNRLFWTAFSTDEIWRSTLSGGSKVKILNLDAAANPLDIVLDVNANQMYWASGVLGRIYSATLNGDGAGIWLSLSEPRSIAIDLEGGKMYWGDQGSREIGRVNLDKSNKQVLFDAGDGVDQPLGVALLYGTAPTCYSLTIVANPSAGGFVQVSPPPDCNGKYTSGTQVTVQAFANSNYNFSNWSGDLSGSNNPRNLTMNADKVVTANFSQKPVCYALIRNHTGQGADPAASPNASPGCEAGQFSAGQSITLTAAPAAGWHVAGWSGTNNDASTLTTNTIIMPVGAYAVSVAYVQDSPTCHTLSRTHTGQGGDPVASPAFSSGCGTGQFTAGQSITLNAAPAAGWHVAGWSGTNNDGSTSNTNTVTMPTGAHAISVAYEQDVPPCYTLNRTHTGQGSDPVSSPAFSSGCGTGQYIAGQSISLTVMPAPGWQVAGWSGTNNNGSTATTNTVTMPSNNHTISVSYQVVDSPLVHISYAPVVLFVHSSQPQCFAGPNEVETNNSGAEANGPLCSAGTYTGLSNDDRDFFMFETKVAGTIRIEVSNLHVNGVQLSLYFQVASGQPIKFDTEQADGLLVKLDNAQVGRYYIRIFTSQPNPAEARPYTMQVSFP